MDQHCKPSKPPRWRPLRGIGTFSRRGTIVSPPVSANNRSCSFSTLDGSSISDQASASTMLLCERAITYRTEPDCDPRRESECVREAAVIDLSSKSEEACILEAKGLPFVRATTMTPAAEISTIDEEAIIIHKGYSIKSGFHNRHRSLDDESILMPNFPTACELTGQKPEFQRNEVELESIAKHANSDILISSSLDFVSADDDAHVIPREVSCHRESSLGGLTLNSEDFSQSNWNPILPSSLTLLPNPILSKNSMASTTKIKSILRGETSNQKPKRSGFTQSFSNVWSRKGIALGSDLKSPRKLTSVQSSLKPPRTGPVVHQKHNIPRREKAFGLKDYRTRGTETGSYYSQKCHLGSTEASCSSVNAVLCRMNNAPDSLESDSILSYVSMWKDLPASFDEMQEVSLADQTHSLTRTTEESASTLSSSKTRDQSVADRAPSATVEGTVVSFPSSTVGDSTNVNRAPSVTRTGSSTIISCSGGNLHVQKSGNLLKIEVTDAVSPHASKRIELPLELLEASSSRNFASLRMLREPSAGEDSSMFSSETELLNTVRTLTEECPGAVDLLINFRHFVNSIGKAFFICKGGEDYVVDEERMADDQTFDTVWDTIQEDENEDVSQQSFEADDTSSKGDNDEHLLLLRSYSEALSQIAQSVKVMAEIETMHS